MAATWLAVVGARYCMHEMLRQARTTAMGTMTFGMALGVMAAAEFLRDLSRRYPVDVFLWLEGIGVLAGVAITVAGAFRLISVTRRLRGVEVEQDARFFARAGLPRSVYELLLGIAAVDGYVGDDERDAIARLLTQRWPHGILPQDLKDWAAMVQKPRDPEQLARDIAPLLSAAEREHVLECCREVAAADGRVDDDEHDLLDRITALLHLR
jgi:uncharacterized tellurite resistance protein B-like protein